MSNTINNRQFNTFMLTVIYLIKLSRALNDSGNFYKYFKEQILPIFILSTICYIIFDGSNVRSFHYFTAFTVCY